MAGAERRNNVAALDLTTGSATAWNPNVNGPVDALAQSGSTIYVGGFFSTIGGQARHFIGAVDAATGSATSWNPNGGYLGGDRVTVIEPAGATIYVAGAFIGIGGQPRNHTAALDATTGAPTAWNPNPNGGVSDLALSGSTLYVRGSFTNILGQTRGRIAAFDVTTGNLTSWDPTAGGTVSVLALNGSTVIAGGSFPFIGGAPIRNLAALDASTGAANLAWTPDPNGSVSALLVGGPGIYVSGGFSTIGGQSRAGLAVVDLAAPYATSWNPNQDGLTSNMTASGTTVYIGGRFDHVGGFVHYNLAGIDAATTGVAVPGPLDHGLAILGIRPNPSAGDAVVEFTLPRQAVVELCVYDVSGREVMRPMRDQRLGPGVHRVPFDGRHLGSGVYVCLLRADGHTRTSRWALVR